MAHIIDGAPKMRIGFFLRHESHRPILEPIAHQMYERGNPVRISPQKWKLILFNPHVLVAAENVKQAGFHHYLPFTRFVHTRQALVRKGAATGSASFSHYTCVSSHPMKDWYRAQGVKPREDFWITGYPQMDVLFQDGPAKLEVKIPARRRVILYAPTHQPGFTSINMLGAQTLQLLGANRDDTFVIIKPHPLIEKHHPDWREHMRVATAEHPNAYLVERTDGDLMPFLKAADILVSDVSSAMLTYLALDRPIILLNNPDYKTEPGFDPDDFEWAWRDAAREVTQIGELPGAINRALADPSDLSWRRREYQRILFGDLIDGRSVNRICSHISHLDYETAGAIRMGIAGRIARALHAFVHGKDEVIRAIKGVPQPQPVDIDIR